MSEDFLTSQKATDALSKMRTSECTLEQLEISKDEIDILMKYFKTIKHNEINDTYYIVKFNEENFEIVSNSSEEAVTEKWLEISDLYLGSDYCDMETLKYVLDYARDNGCTSVHIAGDLCAGHPKFKSQDSSLYAKTARKQADIAVELFSKYPMFEYYCINGERDLSFYKGGEINPIILVQRDLTAKKIKFNYINEMVANLVICGVVKRLQHGKGNLAYTKSYKIEREMWAQFENMSDNVVIGDTNYNIRFVQFGHYHVNCLQELGGIMITSTPGMILDDKGILQENTSYPAAKVTEVTIKDGQVTKFVTTNICKPRKVRM